MIYWCSIYVYDLIQTRKKKTKWQGALLGYMPLIVPFQVSSLHFLILQTQFQLVKIHFHPYIYIFIAQLDIFHTISVGDIILINELNLC